MGRRLDPFGSLPAGDGDLAAIDVGAGYYAIAAYLLIEKGDEYLHASGRFIPFPLEAVGRPLATGLLARRALAH